MHPVFTLFFALYERKPHADKIANTWERIQSLGLGYFNYANPDIFERLRGDIMHHGFFGTLETGHDFSVDTEELAEGSADLVIKNDISYFLEREGINTFNPRGNTPTMKRPLIWY